MIDDITEQLVDTIFANKRIKENVYPVVYGVVAFNVILFMMVLYIAIKMYCLKI
jgi:hypothetical protein|tara:strand:+ start:349 stop:510 length:162 start_codon:yes stop_codon:yes gene_type:complete